MKKWYIVTTYSGYENSVKTDLERRRVSMGMEDKIYQVLIPEETVIVKDKKGNEKEKVNKIFPGYVFIEMEIDKEAGMDKEVWFMIRNTPKVTGFLGSSGGGTKPVPVRKDEMDSILTRLGIIAKPKLDIYPGDKVMVIDGAFKDNVYEVSQVNEDKGLIVVLIEMLGMTTTMELEAAQVKKI